MIFTSVILVLFGLLLNLTNGYCPRACACNNERLWVKCDNFSLNSVPITLNPHITSFTLHNSNISTLNQGLQFYEALQDLDFSRNQIKNLGDNVFSRQVNLVALNLSWNKITSIGAGSLDGLLHLQFLDLQYNHLDSLEPGWAALAPSLRTLLINNNMLHHLHQESFGNTSSLLHLDLSSNYLSEAPNLSAATRLVNLTLHHNKLVKGFSFCSLGSQINLRSVNLSHTSLSSLTGCTQPSRQVGQDAGPAEGLPDSKLEILDISGNYLTFPLPELAKQKNLEKLYAGQKNISVYPSSSFSGLSQLKEIIIQDCPMLATIQTGLFWSNKKLEYFRFQNNPNLEVLPAEVISTDHLSDKLVVDLVDNGLGWLDKLSLPWEKLTQLNLSGNPLHCDCSAYWMISTFKSINLDTQSICYSPTVFTGLAVSELDPGKFSCTTIDPVQICLVAMSIALVCLTFCIVGVLVQKTKKSGPTVRDVNRYPGYLEHYSGTCKLGWPEKPACTEEGWDYMESKCSCKDLYQISPDAYTNATLHNNFSSNHQKSVSNIENNYTLQHQPRFVKTSNSENMLKLNKKKGGETMFSVNTIDLNSDQRNISPYNLQHPGLAKNKNYTMTRIPVNNIKQKYYYTEAQGAFDISTQRAFNNESSACTIRADDKNKYIETHYASTGIASLTGSDPTEEQHVHYANCSNFSQQCHSRSLHSSSLSLDSSYYGISSGGHLDHTNTRIHNINTSIRNHHHNRFHDSPVSEVCLGLTSDLPIDIKELSPDSGTGTSTETSGGSSSTHNGGIGDESYPMLSLARRQFLRRKHGSNLYKSQDLEDSSVPHIFNNATQPYELEDNHVAHAQTYMFSNAAQFYDNNGAIQESTLNRKTNSFMRSCEDSGEVKQIMKRSSQSSGNLA